MSRISQLPPRFPVRNAGSSTHLVNPISPKENELEVAKCRLSSQGSVFEEQPKWLDDRGTSSKLTPLRRTVSDPVATLEGSSIFDFSALPIEDDVSFTSDASGGLDADCLYGPNSPRNANNLTPSESSVVSAVLESVNSNPFQFVTMDGIGSCVSERNARGENFVAANNLDTEQQSRRHNGQRSRVRKLQYIAELEKTVNVYQAMGAEMAAKVAFLFQQRAILSLENSTLRNKIASLKKEKVAKDGQYQSLKNEVNRLKSNNGRRARSKSAICFPLESVDKESLPTNWSTLNIENLSLKEKAASSLHGFGN